MALDQSFADTLRNRFKNQQKNDFVRSSIGSVFSKKPNIIYGLSTGSNMPGTGTVADLVRRTNQDEPQKLSFSVDGGNKDQTNFAFPVATSGTTAQSVKEEDINPIARGVTDTVFEIGKETARFVKSSIESPRVAAEEFGLIERKERGQYDLVETYQEGVRRRVEEGDSVGLAIAKTFGQVALEEPVGYAFKPLFFGLGITWRALKGLGRDATEQFIEGVARSTSEDDIVQMFKRAVPEISENDARTIARELVNVDDIEQVRSIIQGVGSKVDQDIAKGIDDTARTTDEVAPTVARTADEVAPTVARTADETAADLAHASDALKRAASEMKAAGKTFDDFVKAQGTPVYHGTSGDFSEIKSMQQLREAGANVAPSNIGGSSPFIHVTENKNLADWYARTRMKNMGGKEKTLEAVVNGKILDLTNDFSVNFMMVERGDPWLMKKINDGGYVGVKFIDRGNYGQWVSSIAVLPDAIKTRSQLTDIWNKAHAKSSAQQKVAPARVPVRRYGKVAPARVPARRYGEVVGTKERKFVTSVKEELPEVGKMIVDGQYVPRSTDALSQQARDIIETNLPEAQRIAMEETNDLAVAVGVELLKYYNNKELYEAAADLAMEMAPKLTELGRSIQAASLLSNLTAEGQIKLLARALSKWNKSNPGRPARKISEDEVEHITNEMKAINAMEIGIDREIRFHRLRKYIGNIIPSPWWKKVTNVWKAGLLTGIKTSGLNIFSNAWHSAFEIAKDIPAAAVDSVASLFTGKRTKTFTTRGYAGGAKKGFERGWTMLKTGYDERNSMKKLDYKRVSFGKGRVAKVFQVYTDTVFQTIGAQDQLFYYGAVARSIADQAIALGKTKGLRGAELRKFVDDTIQNPTEEIVLTAIHDGKTAVFQQETYIGNAGKKIQSIPGAEFVVPFAQTPGAVATQVLNYTPLGIAGEITRQIYRGVFDQRKFSEAIGRGLVGVGVAYLGWKLMQKGMVALDYPQDEREREQWKLEGKKPNSILINGKWRSPIVLGPAGNVLLVGAHLGGAYEETGSTGESAIQGSFGALKSFTEQTFLTGLSSLANAINDPERNATSFFAGLISSTIPTIINDIAKATDPLDRRTRDESVMQTIMNRVQSRIPILRQELEPVMTSLGDKKLKEGNFFETMFDPTRPSTSVSSPVIDEIKRLTREGYNVSPTLQGSSIGYNSLSPEENTIMWAEVGAITKQKLEALFNAPAYQRLSDEEKADKVDEFIKKSKNLGRAKTIYRLTRGMSQEEYVNALKLYKHSAGEKLLTEAVYRELVNLQNQ